MNGAVRALSRRSHERSRQGKVVRGFVRAPARSWARRASECDGRKAGKPGSAVSKGRRTLGSRHGDGESQCGAWGLAADAGWSDAASDGLRGSVITRNRPWAARESVGERQHAGGQSETRRAVLGTPRTRVGVEGGGGCGCGEDWSGREVEDYRGSRSPRPHGQRQASGWAGAVPAAATGRGPRQASRGSTRRRAHTTPTPPTHPHTRTTTQRSTAPPPAHRPIRCPRAPAWPAARPPGLRCWPPGPPSHSIARTQHANGGGRGLPAARTPTRARRVLLCIHWRLARLGAAGPVRAPRGPCICTNTCQASGPPTTAMRPSSVGTHNAQPLRSPLRENEQDSCRPGLTP